MDEDTGDGFPIDRRDLLRLGGAGLALGLTGCTDRGAGEESGANGSGSGDEPSMAVVEAAVSASTVTTEETLEVRATVENRGDSEGTFYAELRMDEVIVKTESVTVAPGAEETVTFSGTFAEPGEYAVDVNGEPAGTVVVERPPPAFEVREATLDRRTVAVGGELTVTATIANVGGQAGTYAAELRVDGRSVTSREVRVEAGAEETVTLTHAFDAPGRYEIGVGATVVDTIRVAPPAAFEITATELDRARIGVGERVEVRATVTNVGNLEGTTGIELRRDGEVVARREVTLAPAETVTVHMPVEFSEAGAYELAVAATDRAVGAPRGVGTVYVRACSTAVSETVTVGSRSAEEYAFDLRENAMITVVSRTREGVDPTLTVVGPSGERLIEGANGTEIRERVTTRAAGRYTVRLDNGAVLPWRSGTWAVEIERCTW
ncbi:CARDB domain-containing protein [Halalkalicoccus jeotgali]|uniref:Cell surface glycoprotein related protein n=1 Tax=Halalkalicoccus jeotgali (strain DSM 18796 / CECT 7217 / JCM 14584 / KCTC 4019 / B3) TaxID=795797 RepID=D8J7Y2_HALJB|nr:CARDB domain-containing protein [Halalkalicoccus jeotgali]ADJ14095.1 cell surface glycoprotein related protein [Halalkalicoccus jeotgali B3]ELY34475.1 cell surface glycoprotein-like protein [Halalkalicoccus jeotgali B3]